MGSDKQKKVFISFVEHLLHKPLCSLICLSFMEHRAQEDEESIESLQLALKAALQSIKSHHSAWPFLKPVDPDDVPDYYEVITDPIGTSFFSQYTDN